MRVILIVFAIVLASASAARIQTCKSSGVVDLKNVKITGCSPTKRECVFKRGEDATMQLPFTPTLPSQNVTAFVHGIIVGVPIPFPLPNRNACLNSGFNCPLVPNQQVIYSADLPVKLEYPAIRVTVQWELRDDNGNDITCIKFPVQLV